ncbi:class I SAM-dependent methyltransferase [Candidatus Sumerlaeota bacterium]|nr:class I SAM-dependent methyltransferase [Candidatus Sumerlaeota bacterium]
MIPDPRWYESAFDREYLDVYAHRDEEDAERALTFLEGQGLLRPGARILDLCCGNGRHVAPLCREGHRVFGFDLSQDLLRDFQARTECPVPLVRGDMRHLSFRPAFDLVLSLFTSFGYFQRDGENWLVFDEVADALKPGGAFVFDFLNAPRVEAGLIPHSERELSDGLHVKESRRIEHGRVIKTVRLSREGAVMRVWVESVRLFTRVEIERAMRGAGLEPTGAFGDFAAAPHGDDSPRLILVAHR